MGRNSDIEPTDKECVPAGRRPEPGARYGVSPTLRCLKLGVLLVWLGLVCWLIRYEAFPGFFTRTIAGYEQLLSEDLVLVDSWMSVLHDGVPTGYTHTTMEMNEDDPDERYTVESRIHLNLNLLGKRQDIYATSSVYLDSAYLLQRFSFLLTADRYRFRLEACRAEGTTFEVVLKSGTVSQTATIEIPDDVILYSPASELALTRLRPGQQARVKTLDPATLGEVDVIANGLRTEAVRIGGVAYEATVVEIEYQGLTLLSWIDDKGRLLKQQTPFGWSIERCTADEAIRAARTTAGKPEILAGMAVPSDRALQAPRRTTELILRLNGVAFEEGELASTRQRVRETDGEVTELVVWASRVPSGHRPWAASAPGDFVTATTAIQSDHPEIRSAAETVIRGCPSPKDRAKAIFDWVHRRVRKEMTISLPSALDVLRTMRGDCNEHTYLFVALARAVGLPSRVVVGLAYSDDAFFYHAWPEVWLEGQWVELDPTWGQWGVDATHLAIVRGELASQTKLLKLLGRLRIEVIEEKVRDPDRAPDKTVR